MPESYSDIRLSLIEQTKYIAKHYSSKEEFEEILDRIKENRKTVQPLDLYGSVVGIDGSMNSIEIFGGFYIQAVSAVAKAIEYPDIKGETLGTITSVIANYQTPHSSLAPRMLMHAFEAFLAYKSVRKGIDYILLDGGPLDIYNAITGSIAGALSTLEEEILMILSMTVSKDTLERLGVIEYENKTFVKRGSILYKALQEGLEKAYKKLEEAFNFRSASVDAELLQEALASSRIYGEFRAKLLDALEHEDDLDEFEIAGIRDSLMFRRYYLEPIVNAFAAYGIYIKSLDRLFSNLGESIIVGASKRINRVTVEFEQLIARDLELRSRIGYALSGPFLEAPGFLKLLTSKAYQRPSLKLTGHIPGISRVREFLEGEKTKFLEVLFKPTRRSILRLEIYYNGETKIENILGVLARLSIDVRPGSATVTFRPIEQAHRIAEIDNKFMEKLKRTFEKHLSQGE